MTGGRDQIDLENQVILGGNRKFPTTWNELSNEMELVKYEKSKDYSDTLDLSIYEKELDLLSKIVQKGKAKSKLVEIRDRNLVRIKKLQDILNDQTKQLEEIDLELIVLITEKQLLTSE